MDSRPIGIFDSGLGGLTVVKELLNILPNENIVYFGDIGRVPYGTRGKDKILKYAKEDIKFLLSKDVKLIISACGTVSANLSEDIVYKFNTLYTGVLIPSVKKACNVTKNKCIGVIGTSATIRSGEYQRIINSIDNSIEIIVNDCPLFVPLVENGFFNDDNEVTKLVAEKYLKVFLNKIDTLILGCTHYPIIENIIKSIIGKDVILVDCGKETARYAKFILEDNNILNFNIKNPKREFYVSDDTKLFMQNANIFLNNNICGNVEYIDIENF